MTPNLTVKGEDPMTHKISVLAILLGLALSTPTYAAQPQQIEFPPVADQRPALVTPSNPFPVEEQGGVGINGSTPVENGIDTVLFGGITPPHGFMVCINFAGGILLKDDSDSTPYFNLSNTSSPFNHNSVCFVTPLGYRPSGPVHVISAGSNHIFARAW
jgi:hypothetical protein